LEIECVEIIFFLVELMQKLAQKKNITCGVRGASISNNVMASKLRREYKNITEVLQVSMH
jgi:hypothetical protein